MTNEEAKALLLELGKTSEEIAANLLTLGCKGNHLLIGCPIAQFLGNHGGEVASVDAYHVDLSDYKLCFVTPHPISQFVRQFDDGEYPELEL